MTDTSGRACRPLPRDTEGTSPEVGTAPSLTAAAARKGPPGEDGQSLGNYTTPERAVSTNLRTNSTHDILARESNTTKDATKILLLTAMLIDVALAATSLDHATLSEVQDPLHPTRNIRSKQLL